MLPIEEELKVGVMKNIGNIVTWEGTGGKH
jgi:hypothetical protein